MVARAAAAGQSGGRTLPRREVLTQQQSDTRAVLDKQAEEEGADFMRSLHKLAAKASEKAKVRDVAAQVQVERLGEVDIHDEFADQEEKDRDEQLRISQD